MLPSLGRSEIIENTVL